METLYASVARSTYTMMAFEIAFLKHVLLMDLKSKSPLLKLMQYRSVPVSSLFSVYVIF